MELESEAQVGVARYVGVVTRRGGETSEGCRRHQLSQDGCLRQGSHRVPLRLRAVQPGREGSLVRKDGKG